MAVAFWRIRSRSRFCIRAVLRKLQADKKKLPKKIEKLDKEKQKSLSLDHLYQNQNQGTTTSKHVVQHGEAEEREDEEQQNRYQKQLHFHHQPPRPPKKRTHLSPSPEHANGMGESSNHQRNHSHTIPSSRLGIVLRNSSTGGGEIVKVQGGHIVRSTGRKDCHSKVCTAKGPRDRRVRLAAHTAIQFYDVQERLGYDRPSKAVDWLIKKAKSAIDELAELPAWNPTTACSAEPNAALFQQEDHEEEQQQQHQLRIGNDLMIVSEQQGLHQTGNGAGGQNAQDSSFLPPSLDSDAIADTIKSFFPMGASAGPSSSVMQFQSFPTPDLFPSSTQSQDLRLSLQSFPDPAMLHHHHQNPSHHTEQPHSQADNVLLGGTPLGFGGTAGGWPEQQVAELSCLHRLGNWNAAAGGDTCGSGLASAAGYLLNLPPPSTVAAPLLQQMFSHNQFYSQRGPLQSSNTPSVRAWMDPAAITIANAMADHNTSQQQQQENQPHHHYHHHHHPSFVPIYPSSLSGIGGFSGFHIPARIQGDEEDHDGYSDKPSSASSDSRH